MQFIDNLTIRKKLAVLVAIPIVGLVAFAVGNLRDSYQAMSQAGEIGSIVELSIEISAVIHESQRERGLSATYLTSRGETFAAALRAQRARTDAALADVRAALNRSARQETDAEFREAFRNLTKLVETRQAIDELRIRATEATAFYTNMHRDFLESVEMLALRSSDAQIIRLLQGYSDVMQLKEHAGQERALLAQVFAQDSFANNQADEAVALATEQEFFARRLVLRGTADLRNAYETRLSSECAEQSARMRAAALSRRDAGRFGIEPQLWFEQITCKIDLLKEIEDTVGAQLGHSLEQIRKRLRISFAAASAAAVGVIAISLLLVLSIVGRIVQQARELVRTMQGFAGGDLESVIEVRTQDELGQIGASFNDMARTIIASNEAQQAAAERERRHSEQLKQRVSEYGAFLDSVAKGDLTHRLAVSGDDDLARLGHTINQMTASLSTITDHIRGASSTISSSLEEMRSAVATQSSGAAQQAAAINEMTTTLEEIRVVSGQTAEKAQVLGGASERTRHEGDRGLQAVKESIDGMRVIRDAVDGIARTILALNEQTQQIGEITAAMSRIAQQSKMLALNASIEAAKAGEAGKGFAVVAEEVRSLAEQSQRSTAQVQKILTDIRHATDHAVLATEEGGKGVARGAQLAEQAGEAISKLIEVIRETTIASKQIVAAVRQEAAGIDQVSGAMKEINRVTAQFVASSEQTKSSAADLQVVVGRLQQSISVYKV